MKSNMTNELLYKLLCFIKQFHKQYGYCPSIREICDGMEIKSTASAFDYINKLIELGYLEKAEGKRRAIKITRKRAKKLLENT